MSSGEFGSTNYNTLWRRGPAAIIAAGVLAVGSCSAESSPQPTSSETTTEVAGGQDAGNEVEPTEADLRLAQCSIEDEEREGVTAVEAYAAQPERVEALNKLVESVGAKIIERYKNDPTKFYLLNTSDVDIEYGSIEEGAGEELLIFTRDYAYPTPDGGEKYFSTTVRVDDIGQIDTEQGFQRVSFTEYDDWGEIIQQASVAKGTMHELDDVDEEMHVVSYCPSSYANNGHDETAIDHHGEARAESVDTDLYPPDYLTVPITAAKTADAFAVGTIASEFGVEDTSASFIEW